MESFDLGQIFHLIQQCLGHFHQLQTWHAKKIDAKEMIVICRTTTAAMARSTMVENYVEDEQRRGNARAHFKVMGEIEIQDRQQRRRSRSDEEAAVKMEQARWIELSLDQMRIEDTKFLANSDTIVEEKGGVVAGGGGGGRGDAGERGKVAASRAVRIKRGRGGKIGREGKKGRGVSVNAKSRPSLPPEVKNDVPDFKVTPSGTSALDSTYDCHDNDNNDGDTTEALEEDPEDADTEPETTDDADEIIPLPRASKSRPPPRERGELPPAKKKTPAQKKIKDDYEGRGRPKGGRPRKYPDLLAVNRSDDDGRYHCPRCESTFKQYASLVTHFGDLHAREYLCKFCPVKFTSKYSYYYHRDLIHNDGKGKLRCPHCSRLFHLFYYMTRHIEEEHPELKKKKKKKKVTIECKYCSAELRGKFELARHMFKLHHDMLAYCEGCTKPFVEEEKLYDHIKNMHFKTRFELLKACPYCSKYFALEKSLLHHLDENHEEKTADVEKSYACPIDHCRKRFRFESSIARHVNRHPPYQNAFPADGNYVGRKKRVKKKGGGGERGECGGGAGGDETDATKEEARRQCPICGKLVSHGGIAVHLKVHEPIPCKNCDQIFPNRYQMLKHRSSTHMNLTLTCPKADCSKVCNSRKTLKAHMVSVHSGTKHGCDQCGNTYAAKADLVTHVRGVHEGIKVYCAFCRKDFVRPSEKNRHERQVHGSGGGR